MTFDFLKLDKELIAIYTPAYGANEILKKIKTSDGHNIKNIFWVEKNALRELEDYDEDSICFAIGEYVGGYVEINQEIIVTRHKFFFSEDIKFNQKMFVANKNVSILRKIDEIVDGDIYIGGEKQEELHYIPYGEFKALIELFPNSSEMTKYHLALSISGKERNILSEKRRDSKNRILRRGESQGADGRYQYRYTDPYGQRKAVYSWRLVATDPIPAGKRDNLPLREQIKRINRDLQDLIAPDGGQITVLGLVKKYINQKRGVKLSTQAGYGTVINFLEKEPFGARKIDQVRLSDAKEWLIKLQREDGKSYSTLHTIRGVLRPAFQMAVDDDIIRKNPFDFLLANVVVNDSVTREALTRKEERAFLDFIKSDKHYSKYYDGMYILFKTGMRISEFVGLTVKDVDLENRTINIDHQLQRTGSKTYIDTTKTSAGKRVIPMTDDVYECFRRIIARRRPPKVEPMIDGYSGFLWFDKDKKPMVALHWEKYFQHAVEKYNRIYQNQLPKITPHVCRHTYCSNMAKAGMNPKVLQYLMGHSDIGVTLNTYTHLKLDDAKEEMEKLAKKQAKADDELRQMGRKSDGIRIRKFG